MKSIKGTIQVIGDLIKINKGRADFLERILNETGDLNIEFTEILTNKINESRVNVEGLANLMMGFEGGLLENPLPPGKIFWVWSDNKKRWNGNNGNALLNECKCGEEAIFEAYKTALTSDSLNDYNSRKLIMDQKYALQTSHDRIKKYHDLQQLIFQTDATSYLYGV